LIYSHVIRKLRNQRAQRVLAAASEEFARRGFEGARVDLIARRAGVNKQLVFYYYHSKRGLFQAVIAAAAQELEQALVTLAAPDGRPLERIRRTLEAQFDYMARKPELVALLSQGGRAEGASFAPAIKRVVVLLAEGQGRGEVRDDLDPHVAAAQALVLMVGYLRHEGVIAASAPSLIADEPALRERWRKGVVDLVVNGVRA
jgi:TetR/AcrR family transcriptional regulator